MNQAGYLKYWSPDISLVSQHYEEKQALLQHQEQPSSDGAKKEVCCMSLLLYWTPYKYLVACIRTPEAAAHPLSRNLLASQYEDDKAVPDN